MQGLHMPPALPFAQSSCVQSLTRIQCSLSALFVCVTLLRLWLQRTERSCFFLVKSFSTFSRLEAPTKYHCIPSLSGMLAIGHVDLLLVSSLKHWKTDMEQMSSIATPSANYVKVSTPCTLVFTMQITIRCHGDCVFQQLIYVLITCVAH